MTYGRYNGAVTGTVFMDNNDNARADRGDAGLSGVAVRLLTANGHEVARATTDGNGNYWFGNVRPGKYKVDFPKTLDGKELVTEDARGSNFRNDSDANVNTGESHIFTVRGGNTVREVDAGFKATAPTPPVFVECDDPNAVKIDFENFGRGDKLNQVDDLVMVTAGRGTKSGNDVAGDAMVFDTDNISGGDGDLRGGDGKVLIISEDGDSSDPDDNVNGGTLTFTFKAPSDVFDLKVIDGEEGGEVRLYGENGNLIKTVAISRAADGEVRQILLEAEGVVRMEVELTGSGAIDDICYVPGVLDTGNAALEGTVFMDNNDNSVEDAGDMTLAGVTVTLRDADGNAVATQQTDGNGNYRFDGLDAGTYSVSFPTGVDGKILVDANAGGNDAIDSDAGADGATGPITLGIGEVSSNNDAGFEQPAPTVGSLSGRYFHDSDDDNQDNGNGNEAPAAGILVMLLDAAGNATGATTTTDANGNYSFGDLAPGDYGVKFTDPDGVLDGKRLIDANVGNDASDSDAIGTAAESTIQGITVVAGADTPDNDAGVEDIPIAPGSLSGRYFMDANDNDQDDAEMGVAGVTVMLLDAAGNATGATTTTDADGNYSFAGLTPGDYGVKFTDPDGALDGKRLVNANVGDDATDSDATGDVNESTIQGITVTEGNNTPDNDAGAENIPPAVGGLSGKVFMDNNDNDQNDAGDMAVAGVPVTLLDASGNEVGSTTTAADGSYSFGGLAPGAYSVTFPTSFDGKVLVDANVGDDASDSDADQTTGATGPITVVAGAVTPNNDAGLEVPAPTEGSLSGRYFHDSDDDSQDNGEIGAAGVVVMLLDAAGTATGATTTTDADGNYSFAGLAPGEYGVKFTDPDGVLDGKVLVDANVGPDATDSDAIGDTTQSTIDGITVTAGNDTPDNDAGVEDAPVELASVSGRKWMDANGNSLEDDGEMGVAGSKVILRNLDTGKALFATTDEDGNYSFTGLAPGSYQVRFRPVPGKEFVDSNVGNDDTVDSDHVRVWSNGTAPTATFTLGSGEDKTDVDAGYEEVAPVNTAPSAVDDAAVTCANDEVMVDVTANDTDADGDTLTITQVDGQAIADGGTVTTGSGVEVRLQDGKLFFDGTAAYEALDIGQSTIDNITYVVSDGSATAEAVTAVTFKGAAEDFDDLSASLPTSGKYKITDSSETRPISQAAYDLMLDGTGDARFDGKIFEQAYCLDFFDPVDAAASFGAAPELMGDLKAGSDGSVLDGAVSIANGLPGADNMDLINYVIAQNYEADAQYSGWEVQLAIWELANNIDSTDLIALDAAYGDQADVDAIVADALANGEGFEAGAGDIATFIVDPNPTTPENSQPFIVAINFDDYDCLC